MQWNSLWAFGISMDSRTEYSTASSVECANFANKKIKIK